MILKLKLRVVIFICCLFNTANAQESGLRIDKDTISYVIKGVGDTTLLFLHGWGINKNVWKYQTAHFSDKYKLVCYDLAGFGNSTHNRDEYTVDMYSRDLGQIILQLNLKNVVIIAHSMSANVAIEYLSKKPAQVIGFVGVDVFKELQPEIPIEIKEEINSFLSLLESDFEKYSVIYTKQFLLSKSSNRKSKKYVLKAIKLMNQTVGLQTLQSAFDAVEKEISLLQNIELPVNLVNSNAQPTDTEALKEICRKGFNLIEIENSGHFPMIEKPEMFNKALNQYLVDIHKRNNP